MRDFIRRFMAAFTTPDFMVSMHKWLTIGWLGAAPPIIFFLSESVPFLVFISVYAVVTGHWSSWQAARVEVNQNNEKPACDHDRRGAVT